MAVRTDIAVATVATLSMLPGAVLADDWRISEAEVQMALYDQTGQGFQSHAETGVAGPEDVSVYQPQARLTVDNGIDVRHDVFVSLDVVSAASPDTVDTISQASKWQEAFGITGQTQIDTDADTRVFARYGGAMEENLYSGRIGAGYERDVADKNATLAIHVDAILDWFTDYRRDGRRLPELSKRQSLSANVGASQLLSPTTIAWFGYGLTYQRGGLANAFNTTPIETGGRYKERFPNSRVRHAASLRLAQHLPALRGTVRAGVRAYTDSFEISALTAEAAHYQYFGRRLLVSAQYRWHQQSEASFYAESFPRNMPTSAMRTSDSDLDDFVSHEVGGTVSIQLSRESSWQSQTALELSFFHYRRNNQLQANMGMLGLSRRF